MKGGSIMDEQRLDMQHLRHYHKFGLVADPGPDILLNKDLLARLKVQILDLEIIELKNQIKLAESYKDMLREQYKMK